MLNLFSYTSVIAQYYTLEEQRLKSFFLLQGILLAYRVPILHGYTMS